MEPGGIVTDHVIPVACGRTYNHRIQAQGQYKPNMEVWDQEVGRALEGRRVTSSEGHNLHVWK